MATAIGLLAAATGTDELDEGILLGLVLGIGLSLAHTFVDASFSPEKPRPWTWFAINGSYHALGLVMVAVIIAVWPSPRHPSAIHTGLAIALDRIASATSRGDTAADMELRDLLPGIIGSFVGVTGWLLVGLHIQRRQFMRQARNAAKAVYFELDVNFASIGVARDHGVFADLDRSSFERLLPELASLLDAPQLRVVVDAYMTHAGYRQLASREDLPSGVRRAALGAYAEAHDRALGMLRARAFTAAEMRAIRPAPPSAEPGAVAPETAARAKP